MEIKAAIEKLNATQVSVCNGRERKLVVKVFSPGAIGATPCDEVTSIYAGIDWNADRVLIETAQPLTRLSPEDVKAIHASVKEGQSWHAYQQYIKQAGKIKALQLEIERLTGLLAAPGTSK